MGWEEALLLAGIDWCHALQRPNDDASPHYDCPPTEMVIHWDFQGFVFSLLYLVVLSPHLLLAIQRVGSEKKKGDPLCSS